MRNAETVLGVISERGRRRLPLEDIFRQLFNRDLYLRAYGRIYRNDGAMTPGATPETVDAMSLEKIDAIIGVLRQERYRWTPVRRTLRVIKLIDARLIEIIDGDAAECGHQVHAGIAGQHVERPL